MSHFLKRAEELAGAIKKKLNPYCTRIEVAGSVRRRVPRVNDIDFVLVPSDAWNLFHEIQSLGYVIKNGDKIKRIKVYEVEVDFYFATEETWATLLLIRTGSAANNIRLCSIAKKKGWHLSAAGDGLFDQNGKRIAGDTEESIYTALDLPFQPPEKRS